MKRFRLSTLLLLIVIAALGVALVVQHHRAARREVELQVQITKLTYLLSYMNRAREVERQEADRLRSLLRSTRAKEGDEE